MQCRLPAHSHCQLPACTLHSTTRRTLPHTSNAKCTAASSAPILKPSFRHSRSVAAPFSSPVSSRTHGTRKQTTRCSATSTAVGLGIFFTPSVVAVIYAYFKGKGNVKDGLSRLLTEVTQGYFQPNVGGESIPVAQGELSDLAGDEPLFKALFQW